MNEGQKKFVAEYLRFMDAGRAATAAGYAPERGAALLAQAAVAKAIKAALMKTRPGMDALKSRVLQELAAMAFSDIGDYVRVNGDGGVTVRPTEEWPHGAAAAVAGLKQTSLGVEVKLYPKTQMLASLARACGLFAEEAAYDLMDISDAERAVYDCEPDEE